MRKEEFLTALRAGLTGLSPEGVEKLVEFCSEMIDDRMEDGLTEEEAVAAAGSLDELIQQAKTELLPVKTANFTEKSTFGDTLRTYTAESSICGVAADCGPADFILLPCGVRRKRDCALCRNDRKQRVAHPPRRQPHRVFFLQVLQSTAF